MVHQNAPTAFCHFVKTACAWKWPVAAFCFWGILALAGGSFFSGPNFLDDHGLVEYQCDLDRGLSLGSLMMREIREDLTIRFRPFFFVERILRLGLLGDRFFLWALSNLVMVALTSALLIRFGLDLGLSRGKSAMLSLLTLLGAQASVWIWYGPAESTAFFLLSCCLVCGTRSCRDGGSRLTHEIGFVLTAILMGLTKETFLVLIPAAIWLRLWIRQKATGDGWLKAFSSHGIVNGILLSFLLACLWMIVNVVGTNQIGYAGMQYRVSRLFVTGFQFFAYGGQGIAVLLPVGLFLSRPRAHGSDRPANRLRELFPPLIFAVMVIAPQIVLYAKSGLLSGSGRYLLPASLGFHTLAFLAFSAISDCRRSTPAMARHWQWAILGLVGLLITSLAVAILLVDPLSRQILTLVSLVKGNPVAAHWSAKLAVHAARLLPAGLFLIAGSWWLRKHGGPLSFLWIVFASLLTYNTVTAFYVVRDFSARSRKTQRLFSAIAQATKPESEILLAFDPAHDCYKAFFATKYLGCKKDRPNTRQIIIRSKAGYEPHEQAGIEYAAKRFTTSLAGTDIELSAFEAILAFPNTEKKLAGLRPEELDSDRWNRKGFGEYTLFRRKRITTPSS